MSPDDKCTVCESFFVGKNMLFAEFELSLLAINAASMSRSQIFIPAARLSIAAIYFRMEGISPNYIVARYTSLDYMQMTSIESQSVIGVNYNQLLKRINL